MRNGALAGLALLLIPAAVLAEVRSVVVGDVRVQALSPTLVRIEARGKSGFEDRPTFHVVSREFAGCQVNGLETPEKTLIRGDGWAVEVPAGAEGIEGVRVLEADGAVLYTASGKLENSKWLPGPADKPQVWTIADTPRIVPPAYGLVPAPKDDPRAATGGWDLENGAADVYVFLPKGDYRQLRKDYLQLTGRTPLPPLYAFGYWDSRYHAYSEETALKQIDDYRANGIPLDLLVIDTDWRVGASHGYAPNTKFFPDMPRFLQAAKAKNVRIMFNDHPEPQAKGALDAAELEYRYAGLTGLLKQGVDAWWYDRNWHVGLVQPAPGLRKEVWGMKLYRDATASVRPEQRPLIMANVDGIDNGTRNRPPNMAAHRYPVQWTGDTGSSFQFLQRGVENAVHSGVHTAFAYMSEDLGGHTSSPKPEGYVRWLQYGALSPVCRVHCTKGHARMPWTFGAEANAIVREYVQMRYRLLPVLYAAARENYETGEPMLRRCDLEWPSFAEARRDDQYLLGRDILVAPVLTGMTDFRPVPAGWMKTADGNPGVRGEYFNGTDLSGQPVLTRMDKAVDFDWQMKAPAEGINADHFSVRWTGVLTVPEGQKLRLATLSDDGVRLWIDDTPVIDAWKPQDHLTNEASGTLEGGGSYRFRMEFMDLTNHAVARLMYNGATDGPPQRKLWLPPGEWIDLWTGRHFTGPEEISVTVPLRVTPMFIRAGAIVPLAPAMQYTGQKPWDTITLDVYPGSSAATTLYEDDGISNGYMAGQFRKTALVTERDGQRLRVTARPAEGGFAGAIGKRAWVVRVHTQERPASVKVDGVAVAAKTIGRDGEAMPFRTAGGSPDGAVIEIAVSAADVKQERMIEVELR